MPSIVSGRADGRFRFPDGAVLLSLSSLAVLLLSLALPAGGFPGIDTCAFHALTGLSCPGCGLTRAFCAISHGHLQEAWSLHPFSFPLYSGVLASAAWPLLRRRFLMLSGTAASMALRVWVLVFAASLAVFGVWRASTEWRASHAGSHPGMNLVGRVAPIHTGA